MTHFIKRLTPFAIMITLAIMFTVALGACSDAKRQAFGALGKPRKVTVYPANGDSARVWITTGKLVNEDNSDGFYFEDAATGKLVEVYGQAVVEQIDSK